LFLGSGLCPTTGRYDEVNSEVDKNSLSHSNHLHWLQCNESDEGGGDENTHKTRQDTREP
jgi:hypothetical protein